VGDPLTILIADRNRHVRDLVCRELTAEGYRVLTAKDGREVWLFLRGEAPPDLLVLDLEIPYLEDLAGLAGFAEHGPPLPTIIYCYASEVSEHQTLSREAAVLEKTEDLEDLKAMVALILGRRSPPG